MVTELILTENYNFINKHKVLVSFENLFSPHELFIHCVWCFYLLNKTNHYFIHAAHYELLEIQWYVEHLLLSTQVKSFCKQLIQDFRITQVLRKLLLSIILSHFHGLMSCCLSR